MAMNLATFVENMKQAMRAAAAPFRATIEGLHRDAKVVYEMALAPDAGENALGNIRQT